MSPHILTERRDATLCLTLNKPEILNAWDAPMRKELSQLLKQAESDDTVSAVILTGAGERAFCAGQDLND
jgi:enoyl-CoA hydratase